ncbi:hypothetical protein D3C74_179620 [compost metagenome]
MKKFLKLITILLICVSILNISSTYATKYEDDVNLLINPNDTEQYSKKFDVSIQINFFKKDLYNENVYLSYHVYDESGKEILWEGERYPIIKNIDGKISMDVTLDLSHESALAKVNKGNIKFDLVDEKNVYWFSTNSKITFSSEVLEFDFNFWKKSLRALTVTIGNNPIIFSINIVCFLIFILSLIKIKRNGFFYN